MEEKRKSSVIKLIILTIEALLELILAGTMIGMSFDSEYSPDAAVAAEYLILGICFAVFLIITIGGFVRYSMKKKFILSTGLGMKFLVFFLGMGAFRFPVGEPMVSLFFWIIGGVVIAIIFFVHHSGKKKQRQMNNQKQQTNVPWNQIRFSRYKAKWTWDDAAKEYCEIHNTTLEELTEQENDIIYDYACGYIAYLLAWMIKHDFCSEEFWQEHSAVEIEKIKQEQASPVAFVSAEMDCVVGREDFTEDIVPFLDSYYEGAMLGELRDKRPRTERTICYDNDYYAVIRNPEHYFYCINFSWDIYHRLEERLDQRYRYYLIRQEEVEAAEADYYFPGEKPQERNIQMPALEQSLELRVAKGVTQEYVDRCICHVSNMPEALLQQISDKLYDTFYNGIQYTAEETGVAIDKSRLILRLGSGDIMILPPHGNEPGYMLGFECGFETEHGVGITVRGNEVLDVSYRADVTSPWCYENEIRYQMAQAMNKLDAASISTQEKAFAEVKKGNLVEIPVVPASLGMPLPEQNVLYVPKLVAELKNEYDMVAEKMLVDGYADAYTCTPRYKQDSIIPARICIQATKGEKLQFVTYIEIW